MSYREDTHIHPRSQSLLRQNVAELAVKISHPSMTKQNIIEQLYRANRPLRLFEIARKIQKDEATIGHHIKALLKMGVVALAPVGEIKAYTLSKIGNELYEKFLNESITESDIIDLRARELANILELDVNSEKFAKLRNTIARWFARRKKLLEQDIK